LRYFRECQQLYSHMIMRNNVNFLTFHGIGIGSGLTFSLFFEKPKSDFLNFINKPQLNFEKKISLFTNLLDILDFLIDNKELQFLKPEFLFVDKNDTFKLLYLGNYLISENSKSNYKENITFNDAIYVFKSYANIVSNYFQEFLVFYDYLSSINNELTFLNIIEIKYIQDLKSIYLSLFSKSYKDLTDSNSNIYARNNIAKLLPLEIKETLEQFFNKDIFDVACNKDQFTIKKLREQFLNNFKRKKVKINYKDLNQNRLSLEELYLLKSFNYSKGNIKYSSLLLFQIKFRK